MLIRLEDFVGFFPVDIVGFFVGKSVLYIHR